MNRIIKPAFNGGRISPTLHWRPDLQLHASACKELHNWLPTIEGPVTRRWGASIALGLDPIFPTTPTFQARHYDFQYGQQDFDTVLFHSDTRIPADPEEELDPEKVAISIYNRNGNRVALFLDDEVSYKVADIESLTFLQSFDALYIFSEKYPTYKLLRRSETEWELDIHPYHGGPWKLGNADKTHIITGTLPVWDSNAAYLEGDGVITGTNYAMTGISTNVYYAKTRELVQGVRSAKYVYWYYTRVTLTTTPAGIQAGDKIQIENAIPGAYGNLTGEWEVASVDLTNNTLNLITGTRYIKDVRWENRYEGNDLTSATLFEKGQRQTFHSAKRDNTNVDPTIQPSDDWTDDAFYSGTLTLSASLDTWTQDDVGRDFRLVAEQTPRLAGVFSDTEQGEASRVIPAIGQVTLTTEGGKWDGELALQISLDTGGSWEDIGEISSQDGNRNGTITRVISDFGALVRVYMRTRGTATDDSGCQYYLTVDDTQYSYFTIDEFISTTEVVVSTNTPLGSLPSSWRWNYSVFGASEGYPGTAVILNNTLIVSGVPGSPGGVYFSSLGDWSNWITGSYTGASFELSIGKDTRNVVRWMKSKESLIVGTDAGEWSVFPRDTESTLSLLNYKVERQAEYGSADVPAEVIGDLVVYVERDSFRLRALESSIYDRGTFKSVDISFKVSDYFETDNIAQLAYSRSPIPTLWVRTVQGKLYAWVFDTTNGVSAWCEVTIAGASDLYSISTTPGPNGDTLLVTTNIYDNIVVQAIQLGNDYLDGLRVYDNVNQNTFYYYEGASDYPSVYDSAYIESDSSVYTAMNSTAHPAPRFLRLVTEPTNLRIFFNGELGQEGFQYIRIVGQNNQLHYHLFTEGFVTVSDGTTELVQNTDYFIETGDSCTHLSLTEEVEGRYVWGDLQIETLDPPAILTNDEYVIQSNGGVIVVGQTFDNLTVTSANAQVEDPVDQYDYRKAPINHGFAFVGVSRTSRVIAGYQQDNLVWPVDLLASLQMGGPGGTMCTSQVDLLVKESLGLQFRGWHGWADEEDEDQWISIPDNTPDSIVGSILPVYTGVQRVDFHTDVQYNGVDIQLRAQGPRSSTICSMAVNVERKK